jgi:methionyl-tRNA formyltransferase
MKPRVLFIGCVDFSRALLKRILENRMVEICGVVTKKRSPFNSDHCDLSRTVEGLGIPVLLTEHGDQKEILSCIERTAPQAIYCFGWSHLLGPALLSAAPLGCVGYHPALLPFNRGRHPVIWALALGLPKTGSTFFRMDEGADTGDVLSQRVVAIDEEDDASSLYRKLQTVAERQTEEIDTMIASGVLRGTPQASEAGNTWRKRNKSDGLIDFRMPSAGIRNLIRALRPPYPGAHLEYNGEEYVVGRADILSDCFDSAEYAEPGKILEIRGNTIIVKSGDGIVALSEHTLPDTLCKGEYFV